MAPLHSRHARLTVAALALCKLASSAEWQINRLDANQYPLAKCLDGSPGAYYLMPGEGADANKFLIHMQGGGWCTSIDNCVQRVNEPVYAGEPSLGSTVSWGEGPCTPDASNSTPPCVSDGGSGGILSNNATINPDFHSWTKVWLGYCDGGSFAGYTPGPVPVNSSFSLYFRGRYILDAAMSQLLYQHGMSDATDVILKGCSAGGMAAFYHADHVGDLIKTANPDVRYSAAPGAGMILDFASYNGNSINGSNGTNIVAPPLKWIWYNMNFGATDSSASCVNYFIYKGMDPYLCFFPANNMNYIQTPLFVSNSLADAAQLGSVMALPCNPSSGSCNSSELAYFNSFHDTMVQQLSPLTSNATKNGYWLLTCVVHMLENVDRAWNGITVQDQTLAQTFGQWYRTVFGVSPSDVSTKAEASSASPASFVFDVQWTAGTGKPNGGNPMCGEYGPVPSLPSD